VFKKYIILILCIFILIPTIASAKVRLEAGYLNYVENIIEVSKGVTIRKENVVVTAPQGTLDRKDNKASLNNGVIMEYENGKIEAQEMEAWLETDEYIFKKNVIFKQEQEDKTIDLQSPYLEIKQGDQSFYAKDGVEILYNGKILKSEEADYSEEKGTLELNGNVYIEQENGDWVKGDKAVFYMDSEEERFTVDGKVEVEVNLDTE
jgi:lipopolysaccharide assembly outer membrane protein LptD (OstA)